MFFDDLYRLRVTAAYDDDHDAAMAAQRQLSTLHLNLYHARDT